jgi:hypothetical protein
MYCALLLSTLRLTLGVLGDASNAIGMRLHVPAVCFAWLTCGQGRFISAQFGPLARMCDAAWLVLQTPAQLAPECVCVA